MPDEDLYLKSLPDDPSALEELFDKDVHTLSSIADKITREKCGNFVTFTNNFVVNYTNICVAKCPICAFSRSTQDHDAYVLPPEQICKLVEEAYLRYGILEVHLNGGLNPELDIEYFERTFKLIKSRVPRVTIKGLTCCEIGYYSKLWRMSYREILERLREAGLDLLSGGCLEIYNEEIRKLICPNKISGDEWFRIAEIAASCGILTNATMLFGHIEKPRHIIEHLLKVREFQLKTRSIVNFIPLKFVPYNTRLYREGIVQEECPAPYVLKVIAISRIVLQDTIRRISAYWISLGKKLAQVALTAGANDLVGTMINEKVFRETGRAEVTTVDELAHLIRTLGRQPVLRDSFGNIVRVL